MAKPWAKWVYKDKRWTNDRGTGVRDLVMKRALYLCERCKRHGRLTPAVLVHHRIPLTPENVYDAGIAFNPDNLEALCKDCHEVIHHEVEQGSLNWSKQRVAFDEYGNVVKMDE